jgi:hypothetical protein
VKTWKIILIVVSTTILIVPLTAFVATSLFTDVPDDSIFVVDINWMKTSDITNGCSSAGTEYCPGDNLTRQQMAAFMHRLAMKRVVDAGAIGGKDSKDFVYNAKWESKTANVSSILAGKQVIVEMACPKNKYVVSGGVQSTYKELVLTTSQPLGDKQRSVTRTNTGSTMNRPALMVWAMCAGTGLIALP